MDRTGLADEPRAENLEYLVNRNQRAPETPRIFRIIRSMNPVLIEGNWIGNFHRHLPDFHVDVEGMKRRHELAIEIGNGTRRQRNGLNCGIAGTDDELMLKKIKFNFKNAVAKGNGGGG